MLKAALMVAAAVCLIAGAAQAQSPQAQSSWPNKPVKILVPTAAGGSADNTARMFAPHLSKVLGQQFYIENRGGAGNTLGIEFGGALAGRRLHATARRRHDHHQPYRLQEAAV